MPQVPNVGGSGNIDYGRDYYYGNPQYTQYGNMITAKSPWVVAGIYQVGNLEIAGSQVTGKGPASTGATATPSAPVGAPTDVSLALASVPIAQDGMVITADFHNALRAALVSIAGFLGEAAVNQSVSSTLAPAFLPTPSPAKTWEVTIDRARATNGSAGWMPIVLPDGARLQAFAVVCTAKESLTSLEVTLERVPVEGGTSTTLFAVKRTTGEGTLKTYAERLAVAGITSATALDEFRRVDNSSYRYAVQAKANGGGAAGADHVDIFSLQVAYTRW